jgi:predicted nucleotidyltransferase
MRFRHALDEIFRAGSSVRVLRALLDIPEGMAVSARDVARRAGVSHPTAASVLRTLAAEGLVLTQRQPSSDAFRFNPAHVLAPALGILFEREQRLDQDLENFMREQIESRHLPLLGALLFGSAALGLADERSDIDLAVLCRPSDEDAVLAGLDEVADAVRVRYGNRLNVVVGAQPVEVLERGSGARLWRKIFDNGRPIVPVKNIRSA